MYEFFTVLFNSTYLSIAKQDFVNWQQTDWKKEGASRMPKT